jgi:hypothetical protein
MNHSAIKADFQATTLPLLRLFYPSLSEREYAEFLLRRECVTGVAADRAFYVVLDSCPRNQGAIRVLHERVTTRLDTCDNPYRYWAGKICGGARSMSEPNAILGPYPVSPAPGSSSVRSSSHIRAARKAVLGRIKARVVEARGIPQRLACLMAIAREDRVWLMTVIPPVLPTSQLAHFYAALEETQHDGIFAKSDDHL